MLLKIENDGAKKHAEVITEYLKGMTIQRLFKGRWNDCDVPSFLYSCEYRVKPDSSQMTVSRGDMLLYHVNSVYYDDIDISYLDKKKPLLGTYNNLNETTEKIIKKFVKALGFDYVCSRADFHKGIGKGVSVEDSIIIEYKLKDCYNG